VAHQHAQIGDLLLRLDGVIDPGGIEPRLDVESDRGGGDDQEDCKSSTENDALRMVSAPARLPRN